MYGGLTVSLLLHAGLLGWAIFSFQVPPPLKPPEIQPVEVAIISADELVRLRKGDRSSKKLETQPAKKTSKLQSKKAKPVRRVAAVPPPAAAEPSPKVKLVKIKPLEKAKPVIKPKPDEVALKLAALAKEKAATEALLKEKAAEAAAKRKAELQKKAEKKAKAEKRRKALQKKLAKKRAREKRRKLAEKRRRELKKKRKFDASRIAALLNKIPDAGAPDSGSQWTSKAKKFLPKGPAAGAPEGRDTRLTASQRSLLGAMMKGKVRDCWRVQTGMRGADRLVVEVEVKLEPDGSISGEPRIVNRRSAALFIDASNNAIRALKQCAPYDLPQELYKGGWDHMVVTFDPQKMF